MEKVKKRIYLFIIYPQLEVNTGYEGINWRAVMWWDSYMKYEGKRANFQFKPHKSDMWSSTPHLIYMKHI